MKKSYGLYVCAILVAFYTGHTYAAATDAPTTAAPTTHAEPTSNAPTTEAPTTHAKPTSNAPTTEVPTTHAKPTSNAPTTEAPTTPAHCRPGEKKVTNGSCKNYLECDNTFKWVKKTCNTFCKVFEPTQSKCVWNWNYPCMKMPTTQAPPSTSAGTISSTTTNAPSCTKDGEKKVFTPGDCKDYLECDSGKWTKKSCSYGYDFDKNKLACTWSWWAKC